MSLIKFKEVFNTPFFSIEASDKNYFDDNPYYRINTKDSIICCLLNKEDNLLLAEQFRPNLGYSTLEFPAGGIENNETPYEAARREIIEEMGVDCELIYLGSYRLMMNRTVNKEHLFIGLSADVLSNKAEKGIQTRVIPRRKFSNAIESGNIEQLAALGIIELINIKFGINFLCDDEVIRRIWI